MIEGQDEPPLRWHRTRYTIRTVAVYVADENFRFLRRRFEFPDPLAHPFERGSVVSSLAYLHTEAMHRGSGPPEFLCQHIGPGGVDRRRRKRRSDGRGAVQIVHSLSF